MDSFPARLRAGDPVVGAWVSLSDPAVAELAAGDGFDFVVLDREHTTNDMETLVDQARAVDAAPGDAAALARVSWNDPVEVKRVLDAGVAGIVVPMVESAEEAREAVAATRYPPEGVRGIAAGRAAGYGQRFAEYVETANESVLTVLQVETAAGVEAAADVAAVDGVDALFVGPADLSASLGAFGDWSGEAFQEAVERVLAAGEAAGTPVGTLAGRPAEVAPMVDLGFDFVVAGVDAFHLLDGQERALAAFDEAVEE